MASRDAVNAPLIEELGIRLDVITETVDPGTEPSDGHDPADVILPGGEDLIVTNLLNSGGSGEKLAAFSIGNDLLGLDGAWSTETSTQPGANETSGDAAQVSLLDNGGENRIENLTLHVLDIEGGVNFEGGTSTNQPSDTDGQIANVSAANDLDGNNLKSIFVDGPVQLLAEWNNDGAGDGTNSDLGAGNTIVGGTGAGGAGGGFLETLSVGVPLLGPDAVHEFHFEGSPQQSAELGLDFANISLLGDPDSENILDPINGALPGTSGDPLGSIGDLPLGGILGNATPGDDLGPITDDLVNGALGNLLGGIPVVGDLLASVTGGNILEAVTGDLVGDLLSSLSGGGLGLPDAGGDLLGAIIGGDGDGAGALAGLDLGNTLDMLTSSVDLFDVPAVHGILDGALSS